MSRCVRGLAQASPQPVWNLFLTPEELHTRRPRFTSLRLAEPEAAANTLSVSRVPISGFSRKRTHAIRGLRRLASFPRHTVFRVHPCCCSSFFLYISFYCQKYVAAWLGRVLLLHPAVARRLGIPRLLASTEHAAANSRGHVLSATCFRVLAACVLGRGLGAGMATVGDASRAAERPPAGSVGASRVPHALATMSTLAATCLCEQGRPGGGGAPRGTSPLRFLGPEGMPNGFARAPRLPVSLLRSDGPSDPSPLGHRGSLSSSSPTGCATRKYSLTRLSDAVL